MISASVMSIFFLIIAKLLKTMMIIKNKTYQLYKSVKLKKINGKTESRENVKTDKENYTNEDWKRAIPISVQQKIIT